MRDGLLPVGGRLTRAHISSDAKHQIIIPKDSHVSNLIIDHYHKLSGHSGRQHVLSMIRQKYWIIKANSAVRRILRSKGYLLVIYIDDILLLAATLLELSQAINDTISLLRSLGFTIHDTKSVTTPTQVVNFLGFVLNSQNMTISMVPGKAEMIKSKCHTLVHMQGPVQIREVASVVGLMVLAF